MKKKIVALCLVIALVAIAIVGATMAYFTDKDEATNVFTVGNIDITLVEDFDPDNAELMPGKDVNKDVSIKNDGDNAAWVWYECYVPAALDSIDGSTGLNNVLHVNSLGSTWDKYRENATYWADGQTEALPIEKTWDHDPEVELGIQVGPQGYFETVEIDGIEYHKYVVLYHGKLEAGEETSIAMTKVYLDKKVDYVNGEYVLVKDGELVPIGFDIADAKIIVKAYGIQAEGIADVYAAYKAYQAQWN